MQPPVSFAKRLKDVEIEAAQAQANNEILRSILVKFEYGQSGGVVDFPTQKEVDEALLHTGDGQILNKLLNEEYKRGFDEGEYQKIF